MRTQNKTIKNLQNRLSLLKELSKIKESLVMFCSWSGVDPIIHMTLVQRIYARFENLAIHRGLMSAVDDMKASRLAFTRWLCGRPLSGHVGCPIAVDGLPKVIPREIRFMLRDKQPDLVKAVITMLSISRYIKGGKPIDLEAITSPFKPKLLRTGEISLALGKLGIKRGQERPGDWKFSWITTAGPNGPSISSSLQDLPKFNDRFRPLVEVMLPELLPTIDKLLSWEKSFKLSSLMSLSGWRDDSLRKLSIKADREGKSRIFAIFDYWSQTVLTPLHDWGYSVLRKIPQDCTFNQTEGLKKIQEVKSRKIYYSYDLKSATDRFPVLVQQQILSLIFNPSYADAWRRIMTEEPFRLAGVEQPIKWAVGQPLGAKSSWAMFTLCHHVVVHIAAIRTNSEAHYVLLGDDIVLRGRALAVEYKRIMSSLGVSISEQKSHVSKDTFEFAKNWVHKGINMSGFPIVGFIESLGKPLEMAVLFFFEVPMKGYLFSICPRTLSSFFLPLVSITDNTRLAVYNANRVCQVYSLLGWLHDRHSGWAKYLVQSAGLVVNQYDANEHITKVFHAKVLKEITQRVQDLQVFAVDLFSKVRELPPFKNHWDPEAWPGRIGTSGFEFSSNAAQVPIFEALSKESEIRYSDLMQHLLEGSQDLFSLEELEEFRFPPRPQLKGFEPLRQKESTRTLQIIFAGLNQQILRTAEESQQDAYKLNRNSAGLVLEKD